MLCLYCRQRISPLRSLWDTRFCSADHRNQVLARSARFLREAEDLGCDDPWLEERKRGMGQRTSALVFVTLVAIVGLGFFASNSTPPNSPHRLVTPKPTAAIGDTLTGLMGRAESVSLDAGVRSGDQAAWKDFTRGSEWKEEGSYVRPGRLRIWARSEALSNYEFEFVGQIDRKSMNWAFRAADSRNYYATKLSILRPDTTSLVRYVVLDGTMRDRVELPLPLKLAANTDYRIRLSAQGSRFLTSIDGRVVSSWSDPRISRGGVGFFSDDGEKSLLKWAALSERDSLMGRVLAHFSILLFPPPLVNRANQAVLGW